MHRVLASTRQFDSIDCAASRCGIYPDKRYIYMSALETTRTPTRHSSIMATFRDRLRALPSIVGTPPADIGAADPAPNPLDKFKEWLITAMEAGIPEPHAVTMSTVDAEHRPDARVLTIKDLTASYVEVAFNAKSAKGQQVAQNPAVALSWYVAGQARAVRIRGKATLAPGDVCEADWKARNVSARAVVLAGKQSEVFEGDEEDKWERVGAQEERIKRAEQGGEGNGEGEDMDGVGAADAGWQVWRVEPVRVEFWQGSKKRVHDRLRYERDGQGGWRTDVLWS